MDPAAATIRPSSISNPSQALSNIPSKSSNGSAATSVARPAANKPPPAPVAPVAPRIDLQAIHDQLKSVLPKDQWKIYTESMNMFVTGKLNNEELVKRIGGFVTGKTIQLHNQLLMALFTNSMRDAPGSDVAAWVSASDKPSLTTKLPAGDMNERRLKKEVMALSARERRRLKEIPDISDDVPLNSLHEYHLAKQIRLADLTAAPQSASLNQNWDASIKTHYTNLFSSESSEFPDTNAIHNRCQSIAHEWGLPNGVHQSAAAFLSTATEVFTKEILSTIISRVRSDSAAMPYIQTARFRRRLEKAENGNTKERERLEREKKERPWLTIHDMRLSLTVGDNYLTQLPLAQKKIMASGWEERDRERDKERREGTGTDEMEWELELDTGVDDDSGVGDLEELGWPGAGRDDRLELRGLLDECLS